MLVCPPSTHKLFLGAEESEETGSRLEIRSQVYTDWRFLSVILDEERARLYDTNST